MILDIKRYDNDDAFYAINRADYERELNSVLDAPAALQEFRRATNEIILRQARRSDRSVVKVAAASLPLRASVRGYATFLHLLNGCTMQMLEDRLGFRPGSLQTAGVYLYTVDSFALNESNIAPRGNTDWSAGITPRDLHNLSRQHGNEVGYHREYPAAKDPIIQFIILEEVPYVGTIRCIRPGETV